MTTPFESRTRRTLFNNGQAAFTLSPGLMVALPPVNSLPAFIANVSPLNLGGFAAVHESAIGPKRTWASALHMSAFGAKADVAFCDALMARSGHRTCAAPPFQSARADCYHAAS